MERPGPSCSRHLSSPEGPVHIKPFRSRTEEKPHPSPTSSPLITSKCSFSRYQSPESPFWQLPRPSLPPLCRKAMPSMSGAILQVNNVSPGVTTELGHQLCPRPNPTSAGCCVVPERSASPRIIVPSVDVLPDFFDSMHHFGSRGQTESPVPSSRRLVE